MRVPVVIFAFVELSDGLKEDRLVTAIERALVAVKASVRVTGWEIVRDRV